MYSITEAYGHDHNPYGIYDLDDAALASRASGLKSEISSLMRKQERFEEFCDRIDLGALDERTLADINDNACGNDWRINKAGDELDGVEWEITLRREANEQQQGVDDWNATQDPNWFWNF